MKSFRLFPFFLVVLLEAISLSAGQPQDGTLPQKQGSTGTQSSELKLIKRPMAPFPAEALEKNIEGKVILSIEVDGNGMVSDAKTLSGPPELFQAALDSVKQWQFEPPTHAPVVTTAEVVYGYLKECPGPVSDHGERIFRGRLTSEKGTIVDIDDDIDPPYPPYFDKERKAGVAGEMVLSITVNAKGKVTKVRVIKSLSPHLDKATTKTVRKWRFKLNAGSPDSLPDEFPLHILFRATCDMKF